MNDIRDSFSRPAIKVQVCAARTTSLTATEAAEALSAGVHTVIRDAEITFAPLADGGPGTSELFPGTRLTVPTTTVSGRLTEASYTLDSDTAYIDLAATVDTGIYSPSDLSSADTYGVGVLVADAVSRGAQRIVLAAGGAVTADGGTGILVALAANPVDEHGASVAQGQAGLGMIADLDTARVNAEGAAAQWVILADSDAPVPNKPGIRHLCALAGVDPEQPGWGAGGAVAVGLAWLSSILTAGRPRVTVTPALLAMDYSQHDADLVLAPAEVAQELGAVAFSGDTREELTQAGAQAAADYLRISTAQG